MNLQSAHGYKRQAIGFPEGRLNPIKYNPHLLMEIKNKRLGSQKVD